MSKKLWIGLVVILIISNAYYIYKASDLQNQVSDMDRTINQNIRSEFTSLNTSIHNIANILEQRDKSSLKREAHQLNEVKATLYNSLNLKDSQKAYTLHQQLFIVEKFLNDLAEGRISDEVDLNKLISTILRQQKALENMFYSEEAIEISAISHEANIEKINDLLTVITNEIKNVRD